MDSAKKPVSFSLMSSAFAQMPASPPPQGVGRYQQTDKMQGEAIVREKVYENGVVESQVIDTRSGDILGYSARQTEQKQLPPAPSLAPVVPKVGPIDLDHYRNIIRNKITGGAAAKESSALWVEGLTAELAWCSQKDWSVSRYLCTYRATNKWCDQANGWGKVKECAK